MSKIVLIGPVYPYRGGIAHHTTSLARALEPRHNINVISYRSQFPAWLYPGQSDRDPSQQVHRIQAEYLFHPWSPLAWYRTARQIVHTRPDLVIAQWWTTFWAPAYTFLGMFLRRYKLPLMYLIHNVLPHEPYFFDAWLARLALGQGAQLMCLSEAEERRVKKLLPKSKVNRTFLPVHSIFGQDRLPMSEAKKRLDLPAEHPVALFFGIVRRYKGLQCLIEAIARLKGQGNPVYLVVAGEFWENISVYQAQIDRLMISELVRLENRYIPNEEAPVYFAAADVFVAPYIAGTQSGAAKTALAYGIPTVITQPVAGTEFASIPTPLKIVAPDDVAELAQAISDSLALPSSTSPAPPITDEWQRVVEAIELAAGLDAEPSLEDQP